MKAKPAAVHSGGLAAAWPTVHTATEQLWQSRSWRLHMLTPDAARCWQMPRGSLANDEHAAPRGGRARELARGRVQGAKRTRAPRQNPSHSDSKPDLETGRVRWGRLSTQGTSYTGAGLGSNSRLHEVYRIARSAVTIDTRTRQEER